MAIRRALRRHPWRLTAVGGVLAVVAAVTPSAAALSTSTALAGGDPTHAATSYLVVLDDAKVTASAVESLSRGLAGKYGVAVGHVYRHALRGFVTHMTAAAASRVAADPAVRDIVQDHRITLSGTQSPVPSWGLDRVDERSLPLDAVYTYPNSAPTVRVYVIDSGIRFTHNDFGGRAISGFDAIDGGSADDCNGHGTHVAGTVGGNAYGVAKRVTLVAVRVADCTGSGSLFTALAGIDWVVGDHDPGELAVANMSFSAPSSSVFTNAIEEAVADGVTVVASAGNDNADACTRSPASAPDAITVGSTRSGDVRSPFSNTGPCLDVFAPGSSITSAWHTGDNATVTLSGTSMAAPHAAGAAALIRAANPSFTPQQVRDVLVANATVGVVTDPGAGSPNRLLFVAQGGGQPGNDFGVALSSAAGATTPGGTVTTTVQTTTISGQAEVVTLVATGLPSGASATLNPTSLRTGASSLLRIATSASTPAGTYPVTVVATSAWAVRTSRYTLVVNPLPGCSVTNGTTIEIPDTSAVESTITVAGCAGNAAVESAVEVHIAHPSRGDLSVTLFAPDGTRYPLHNREGGSGDNIDQTYLISLSSEAANGTWKLVVRDSVIASYGLLDTWSLRLKSTLTPGCSGVNDLDVPIPDLSSAESTITIGTCGASPSGTSLVKVRITHPFVGDLVVSVIGPNGTAYVLRDRIGGSDDNVDTTFTVDLSREVGNGTWRLRVQDKAFLNLGVIDSWTLRL